MSRLIDADALIDSFTPKEERYDYDVWQDMITRRNIVRWIQVFPTAQQWIPCSERLPEDNTIVLICTNDGNITDGMVSRDLTDGEVWWWLAGEKQCWFGDEEKVVAWMPLPQPYEEDSNE